MHRMKRERVQQVGREFEPALEIAALDDVGVGF